MLKAAGPDSFHRHMGADSELSKPQGEARVWAFSSICYPGSQSRAGQGRGDPDHRQGIINGITVSCDLSSPVYQHRPLLGAAATA